ncbi:MAG TPA: VWA domain-containing protein [Blastocatellia bacterium]|jgi:Ca-activated chloride channel family protein|nr:VWA domain-containing protein [Blastocatellia bacterium]
MKTERWLNIFALVAFAICLGLVCVSAQQTQSAQQPAPKQKQSDKTKPGAVKQDSTDPGQIKQVTINVRLPVTVTDKNHRFIVDLKESDFEIAEDKTPQAIVSFLPQNNLPLDLAMLMDTSNSVKPKLKFEKDAALTFLATMLNSRQDRALLATFDSQVELHQDLTDRPDLLTQAIDKVKAQGGTRMYDAIYSICEEKMMASTSLGRRHAMVVITDGEDTESQRELKDAIDIAQRSETTVYVISTESGGLFGAQAGLVGRKGDKDLKLLAEETGGRAFFTADLAELGKSLDGIARELRSQYLIAYEPTNGNYDGKYRQVEVKLPKRKDLKARTKKGYMAVPPRATGARQ